jgi:hypothetical protein
MDKFHDSAGVPWEGREFSENSFANDDGSTPTAIAEVFAEDFSLISLFEALKTSRLLIPLLAVVGEKGIGPHGQVVDKSAELSIVAVSTPDGQTAIPAFSSVREMIAWKTDARPVPIEAQRVALAAIAEGHTRVILDPAGRAIALRRPFLSALARGVDWEPAFQSPRVMDLVTKSIGNFASIESVRLFDDDPATRLARSELGIEISVRAGLSREELNSLLTKFSVDLQTQEFLEMVDSISLRVVAS